MTNQVLAAIQEEIAQTEAAEAAAVETVEEPRVKTAAEEAEELRESIKQQMATRRGYAIITSNVTTDTPAFAYTVGLTAMGRPEIILSGNMSPNTAISIIEAVVAKWNKDKRVSYGKYSKFIIQGNKQWPIKVVKVDEAVAQETHTTHIRKTFPLFAHRLVQIYWPDENGYLPDYEKYTTEEGHKQHMFPLI